MCGVDMKMKSSNCARNFSNWEYNVNHKQLLWIFLVCALHLFALCDLWHCVTIICIIRVEFATLFSQLKYQIAALKSKWSEAHCVRREKRNVLFKFLSAPSRCHIHKDHIPITQQSIFPKRLCNWRHITCVLMPCFVFHTSYFWHFCSTLLLWYAHTHRHSHLFTHKSSHAFHKTQQSALSEWVNEFRLCFSSLAFKTSYSISVVCCPCVIFNDSTLFTVGSWLLSLCFFFLYEMLCSRVRLHSAHDIVWYFMSLCWLFRGFRHFIPIWRFFFAVFPTEISYLRHCFLHVRAYWFRNTFQVCMVSNYNTKRKFPLSLALFLSQCSIRTVIHFAFGHQV